MRTVGIADLKARLSEHLRHVRRGHSVVVLDRDTPVARLQPYSGSPEPLVVRAPLRRYASLQAVPLPSPLRPRLDDVVALLLEERRNGR